MFQYFNCNVFFKHPSAHSNKVFMLYPLKNNSITMGKFQAKCSRCEDFPVCTVDGTEFALLCFWREL